MTLTGKTRHRVHKPLFGTALLVLQVEYTRDHSRDLYGSGYYDYWTTSHWRDATLDDVRVEVAI